MKKWKTRSRKVVLDQRPWLVVERHCVELPDGRVIPDWPWVITPDYVNVVVRMENGKFLCFRQRKYGLATPTLGIVGGYLKKGENPLAAGKRELREETGCEASKWTDLGRYRVDPNRGAGFGHLYFADRARKVCDPIVDDLEQLDIVMLSRSKLEQALTKGEIKVLAWAAAVAFALRRTSVK